MKRAIITIAALCALAAVGSVALIAGSRTTSSARPPAPVLTGLVQSSAGAHTAVLYVLAEHATEITWQVVGFAPLPMRRAAHAPASLAADGGQPWVGRSSARALYRVWSSGNQQVIVRLWDGAASARYMFGSRCNAGHCHVF